jgi:hypothetical protein
VTTAFGIILALAAWTVLPLPLAVAVGRMMAAGGAEVSIADLPADSTRGLDLTVV